MMRKGGGDKARGPGQPLAPSPEITYQPFQLVGFEPTGGPEVGPWRRCSTQATRETGLPASAISWPSGCHHISEDASP